MTRFNVTFRCALPVDFDKHPVGEELAEVLAESFHAHSLDIRVADNYEDFAWLLAFNGKRVAPWLLVGYVGDDAYEWLVQINSGVSWLGRLFGRSDQELRERVAEKLHAILTGDARFTDVRWHQGDFSDPGWTPTPGA